MFYLASWEKLEVISLMILQLSLVQVSSIIISLFIGRPLSDSTYRQKVQKLNDEKYKFQNETAQQNVVSAFGLYPVVTDHTAS